MQLGGNGIVPGTDSHQDSVLLSRPFLILSWLRCLVAFLLFMGRQQPAALSNTRKKHSFCEQGRQKSPD